MKKRVAIQLFCKKSNPSQLCWDHGECQGGEPVRKYSGNFTYSILQEISSQTLLEKENRAEKFPCEWYNNCWTEHSPQIIVHIQNIGQQALACLLLQLELVHLAVHVDCLPSYLLPRAAHSEEPREPLEEDTFNLSEVVGVRPQ